MLSVELTEAASGGRPRGPTQAFSGVAVAVDDRPALDLVQADGSRERLATRHLLEGDVWIGRAGTRLEPPLVRGECLVVHLGDELVDEGKAEGTETYSFQTLEDYLVLARPGAEDIDLVYLQHGRWHRVDRDDLPGHQQVLVAPRDFSLEGLYAALGLGQPRSRLSALA